MAVDEIVSLGETYSIVSRYTSFLVLENDAEYRRWKIERRNAQRIERYRGKQRQLTQAIERLQNEALADLGPEPIRRMREESPVVTQANARPQPQASHTPNAQPAPSSRNVDMDFSRGGGALDPISVGIILALSGLGYAMSRRQEEHEQ